METSPRPGTPTDLSASVAFRMGWSRPSAAARPLPRRMDPRSVVTSVRVEDGLSILVLEGRAAATDEPLDALVVDLRPSPTRISAA